MDMNHSKLCQIEDSQCQINEDLNYHMHLFIVKTNRTISIAGYEGNLGDLWTQIYN